MNTNIGSDDIAVIDNLISDRRLSFIVKKISRLANALLCLSGVMNDRGSIKDKLESLALKINVGVSELLSSVHFSGHANDSSSRSQHHPVGPGLVDWSHVSGDLIAAINLLNSAFIIGAVSEKNYRVFSAEISGVTNQIKDLTRPGMASAVKVSKNKVGGINGSDVLDFDIPKGLFSVGNLKLSKNPQKIKFTKESNGSTKARAYYKRQSFIKDNLYTIKEGAQPGVGSITSTSPATQGSMLGVEYNKRQSDILNILKENGNLSIKDFSLRIKDCSEKTIQRELNYMADIGLIGKTGEKRWTRYHPLNSGVITPETTLEKSAL